MVLALGGMSGCGRPAGQSSVDAGRPPALQPALETAPVGDDPDDPAIWVNPADPAASLIIGTNKAAAPAGALVVFGLDGRVRQTVAGLDRPNNVDVEFGFRLGDRLIDIAVVTERYAHRLRVFEIDPVFGTLAERGSVPVLDGESGEAGEPMGIGLYRRPSDAAVFAVVAPKAGPANGYLWQYHLDGSNGAIAGTLVRRFGTFSGLGATPAEAGEIEAIVVDDALGFVYFADERFAVRKWMADPDHADAGRELAAFGTIGHAGDREGLAIYGRADGTGYLVSTDQIEGGSVFRFYPREGGAGGPHDHPLRCEVTTAADETDGLDVWASSLPGFPGGLVVAMSSSPKTFAMFAWDAFVGGSRGPSGPCR